MPTAALRNCPRPGCYNLTKGGPCPACKRGKDKERRRTRSPQEVRFYHSKAWLTLRRVKLSINPLCELDCVQVGKVMGATDVDHSEPISTPQGWAKRLDMDNLRSACHQCHSRRTAREQSGWGAGVPVSDGPKASRKAL